MTHVLLAQLNYGSPTVTPVTNPAGLAALGVVALFFFAVFYGAVIALAVIHLISYYNWGVSNEKYFDAGIESKKTWFWVLTFVPFGSLYYFFAIRPKINKMKKEEVMQQVHPQGQQNSTQPTVTQS